MQKNELNFFWESKNHEGVHCEKRNRPPKRHRALMNEPLYYISRREFQLYRSYGSALQDARLVKYLLSNRAEAKVCGPSLKCSQDASELASGVSNARVRNNLPISPRKLVKAISRENSSVIFHPSFRREWSAQTIISAASDTVATDAKGADRRVGADRRRGGPAVIRATVMYARNGALSPSLPPSLIRPVLFVTVTPSFPLSIHARAPAPAPVS